jgi:TRAP-type mannitol/chloroaromatic compound transport system substrate-binding protein
MYTRLPYFSAQAADYFKMKGIKSTKLSEEEIVRIETIKVKVQEELASKNPDYAKVLKSQIAFQKMFAEYRDAQGDFKFGRTPKIYPNIK